MLCLLIGFLPWIIFGVLGQQHFMVALLLALIISLVTVVRQVLRHSPKILDIVTLAFFVCIAVGLVGFRWMLLATWMSLLVNVTLMAVAWGSLIAGVPFTIQYAREQVAEEFWQTPLFLRINQYITAVWGLDFFLSALVTIYRHSTMSAGPVADYAGLLLSVAAIVFTVWFPDWYRARALRAQATPAEQ